MHSTHSLQHRFHIHKVVPNELHRLFYANGLQTFGLGLISIFIPIYLLGLGYSLIDVILYYLAFEIIGLGAYYVSGRMTAWLGPKHAIAVHYVFKILLLVGLEALSSAPAVIFVLPFLHQMSFSGVAVDTDLSKISTSNNGGSSLAGFFVYEKLASGLSPLIGGVIAASLGFRVSIAISLVFVIAACVLILGGREPVKTRQKLPIKGFPYSNFRPLMPGMIAATWDYVLRSVVWALFLGIFIFADGSGYVGIGIITTISLLLAVVFSGAAGKYSDHGHSGKLMSISSVVLAGGHIARIFTASPISASFIDMFSGSAETGTRIPFYKGAYRIGGKHEKYRVTFFVMLNMFLGIVQSIAWVILLVLVYFLDDKLAFQIFFAATAIPTLFFIGSRKMFKEESPR